MPSWHAQRQFYLYLYTTQYHSFSNCGMHTITGGWYVALTKNQNTKNHKNLKNINKT
jgi:hypothetical protein